MTAYTVTFRYAGLGLFLRSDSLVGGRSRGRDDFNQSPYVIMPSAHVIDSREQNTASSLNMRAGITMRPSRFRLVVTMAAMIGLVGVYCAAVCRPSGVVKNRRTIRARLLMPKDLRLFAVERHTTKQDSFAYDMFIGPRRLSCWRLRINTDPQRRQYWAKAINDHAVERGFAPPVRTYKVGHDKSYRQYVDSNDHLRRLIVREITSGNSLEITLDLYDNGPNSGPQKYVTLAGLYARRFWARLCGKAAIVDSITDVS